MEGGRRDSGLNLHLIHFFPICKFQHDPNLRIFESDGNESDGVSLASYNSSSQNIPLGKPKIEILLCVYFFFL